MARTVFTQGSLKNPRFRFLTKRDQVVAYLTDIYNIFVIFGEDHIGTVLEQMKGTGWSSSGISTVQHEACMRSFWQDNNYIRLQLQRSGKSGHIMESRSPNRLKPRKIKMRKTMRNKILIKEWALEHGWWPGRGGHYYKIENGIKYRMKFKKQILRMEKRVFYAGKYKWVRKRSGPYGRLYITSEDVIGGLFRKTHKPMHLIPFKKKEVKPNGN